MPLRSGVAQCLPAPSSRGVPLLLRSAPPQRVLAPSVRLFGGPALALVLLPRLLAPPVLVRALSGNGALAIGVGDGQLLVAPLAPLHFRYGQVQLPAGQL